jgi:hypothetical protein
MRVVLSVVDEARVAVVLQVVEDGEAASGTPALLTPGAAAALGCATDAAQSLRLEREARLAQLQSTDARRARFAMWACLGAASRELP